jgi:hypothetical protein
MRDLAKTRDGRRTTAGSGRIDGGSATTTTRGRASRRNTKNTRRGSTTLVPMTLSLPRAGPTRTRRTTSAGSSGGRMVTRTANTSPNRNTLQTIAWARSPRNSCLCVRRGSVGRRRAVRILQVAAIPATTSRNRSSSVTNTPLTVKPTIKNSTRAAAREPAITDL